MAETEKIVAAPPQEAPRPRIVEPREPPKKLWKVLGIGILILVLAMALLMFFYEDDQLPLELAVQLDNARDYAQYTRLRLEQLNGFCQQDMEKIYEILTGSGQLQKQRTEERSAFEAQILERIGLYGEDYTITATVTEQKELRRSALRSVRDRLRRLGKRLSEESAPYESYADAQWEKQALREGLDATDLRRLVKETEDVSEACLDVQVTKGYRLTILLTVTGSALEEPEEQEVTLLIYKVDGRWVSENALEMLAAFFLDA